jgi:hypothetical protein
MNSDLFTLYKKLFINIEGKVINIYDSINPSGAKVSHLLYSIVPGSKVGDRHYFRLYRRLKYLERVGLVKLVKGVSGWVEYEKPGIYAYPTPSLLDLIKQVQNSNHTGKSAKDGIPRLYRIPQKCRRERIEAIKTMLQVRDPWLFVRKDKTKINDELQEYLNDIEAYYKDYNFEVEDREILLRNKDNPDDILSLPYLTRFTDDGRKVKNLKTFENAWDKSEQMYNRAVFLTLTTDPLPGPTLWHRNRHMGKAWNRYQSLLKKRFGQRYRYICVNEFQENGLIHVHVVIFGLRYLRDKELISQDWQRCGQGKIVHIYGLQNDKERGWKWVKEKPNDTQGRSPEEYLKKYVKKGLFSQDGYSLYWTVNKRFFTMSRVFQLPAQKKTVQTTLWIYLGTFRKDDIPDYVYQQNRGSPAYSNWDGWERIRPRPGELALV